MRLTHRVEAGGGDHAISADEKEHEATSRKGEPVGNAKTLLDFAQNQNTTV